MQKYWVRWMSLGGASAVALTFALQLAAPAQDNVKKIDIVKNKFSEENVEIKKGQSITWISTDKSKHKLQPKGKETRFKNTGDFKDTATQKFDDVTNGGPIDYECFYHPATMKGKITVK